MPVFGSDPDADVKEWSEYEGPTRTFASKPVNTLTAYFGYHPSMKMSQRFDQEDKTILNSFFSRKLKQGHTDASLKRMVDRFWQSWGAESERPAFTFTSTSIQQKLTAEAEIVKDDDVLAWMLDGMPNTGPFDDPKEMRTLILQHSTYGAHRYPELVADLIRPDDGKEGLCLVEFDNVLMWKLGIEGAPNYDEQYVSLLRTRTALPPELDKRTHSKIRPPCDTIRGAIANIPLQKQLGW